MLLPGTRVANGGTTVNISLILENNYSMLLQFTPFTIFPNPRVDVEDDKMYLEGGQTLVIKVPVPILYTVLWYTLCYMIIIF